jgi:hypothetical protein
VPSPLHRTCFTCLFSIFEKRHFCLNKIAIQGFAVTFPCVNVL